jgi:hypothetical protein
MSYALIAEQLWDDQDRVCDERRQVCDESRKVKRR